MKNKILSGGNLLSIVQESKAEMSRGGRIDNVQVIESIVSQ